mmetsp:Transcript_36074/g.64260  ORF Transcript_36074/g.64260 Transcript_36074/m.64260 type:complete len:130 (+) Transcript_36074:66-455(+)
MQDFAPTNRETRLKCYSAAELGRDAGGKFVMFCRSVQKYDKKPDPPPPQQVLPGTPAEQMALLLQYQYALANANASITGGRDANATASLEQLAQLQMMAALAAYGTGSTEAGQPEEEDDEAAKRRRTAP